MAYNALNDPFRKHEPVLKKGGSYVVFFTEWLKENGLWGTSVASKVLVLARAC